MRVYILRHGKADKDSPTGRDQDRPLTDKGRAQAGFLAAEFRALHPPVEARPQRVISSTAARAQATAEVVAGSLGLTVQPDASLFPDQPVKRALRLLADLAGEPGPGPVLLVGHNPQLEDLLIVLAGQDAPDRLRTGELAALELELQGGRPVGRFLGTVRIQDDE